jgi:hypothetical protein
VEKALQDKKYIPALIQTKLNRPPIPMDLVSRLRQTACLEQQRNIAAAMVVVYSLIKLTLLITTPHALALGKQGSIET